jgi:hypothetical protein
VNQYIQEVNQYIQEGMTSYLWKKVELLLDEDENVWEDLSNADAWDYAKDAQLKLRIRQKNRREDKPKRQSLWDGKPLSEFRPGSIDMVCKHFLNDSCHAGETCPFTHSEAAKAKASKEAAKAAGDEVPEEGFKGLAVPKAAQLGLKKTDRFNPNLVMTLDRHSDAAGTDSSSGFAEGVGSGADGEPEMIHKSIRLWLQTAAHLNKKASLGEYDTVTALISDNLLEIMIPVYTRQCIGRLTQMLSCK